MLHYEFRRAPRELAPLDGPRPWIGLVGNERYLVSKLWDGKGWVAKLLDKPMTIYGNGETREIALMRAVTAAEKYLSHILN